MKNLSNLSKNEEKKSTYKKYFEYKVDEICCGNCGQPTKGDFECECGEFGNWIYKSIYDKNRMEEFTSDLYDNQNPDENY